MKEFLKSCRDCWVITLFLVLLLFGATFETIHDIRQGHNAPLVLRLIANAIK